MRTLILFAAPCVGALIGLTPAKVHASLPGEVTHARNDVGYHAAPYDTPAYYFGTTYSDPYDLLYFEMPPDARYRPSGFTAPVSAAQTIRGQVKNVLADKGEFVLEDLYGKDWTFQLTPSARVFLNGRNSTIADLEVDAHIAVTYERMGNRLVAITIQYSDRMAGLSLTADTSNRGELWEPAAFPPLPLEL